MDEAEALKPLLSELPEWAINESAIEGELSVGGTLARMAALDAGPRANWVRAVAAPTAPELVGAEPATDVAEDRPAVEELLEAVRSARAGLLDALADVADDDWSRPASLDGEPVTLYEIALRIAREDADALRSLAYRIHDARPGRAGR